MLFFFFIFRNFSSEKLHQFFNFRVFRLEQEEYNKEGLQWDMIKFQDNQECLNLLEGVSIVFEVFFNKIK